MAMSRVGNWTKKARLIFNLAFVIVLFFCLLNGTHFTSPLYLSRKSSKSLHRWSSKASRDSISGSQTSNYARKNCSVSTDFHILSRILHENASEAGHVLPESPLEEGRSLAQSRSEVGHNNLLVPAIEDEDDAPCRVEKRHLNDDNECEYIKSHHTQCSSGGFIEYIEFFYCACQGWPIISYTLLFVWLVALLYMLGNTATDYFCFSLKMMSNLLKLHPTVAGVTLLPLGNGAPDVFSSIASFVGADAGQLGFNNILGGTGFVTCIVVGSISLFVSGSEVSLDRGCFVRDEFLRKQAAQKFNLDSATPPLPAQGTIFASVNDGSIRSPLLDPESGTGLVDDPEGLQSPLLQRNWESNATIYADMTLGMTGEVPRPVWGWSNESEEG